MKHPSPTYISQPSGVSPSHTRRKSARRYLFIKELMKEKIKMEYPNDDTEYDSAILIVFIFTALLGFVLVCVFKPKGAVLSCS